MKMTFHSIADRIRLSFSKLTQREQVIVLGGGVALYFFGLIVALSMASGAVDKIDHRTRINKAKLTELMRLQGEYKQRQREQKNKLASLRRSSRVSLVNLVEQAAKGAGVDLRDISPSSGKPNDNGVVESRVKLKARNLSADRLQDFLLRLETSRGEIIIRKIDVSKPYRKDTLNLEVAVTSYRLEG